MKKILFVLLAFSLFSLTTTANDADDEKLAANPKFRKDEVENAYKVLGLPFGASLAEAKAERKELSKNKNPNQPGGERFLEELKELHAAVNIIKWFKNNGASATPTNSSAASGSATPPQEGVAPWVQAAVSRLWRVNHDAYVKLLFNSQYFLTSHLSDNIDAMFELIYRLYNVGFTYDVLQRLRGLNFNPFRSTSGMKYGAVFEDMSQIFGHEGVEVYNSFQLFQDKTAGDDEYSHILVYFDADATKALGLPRVRFFAMKRESDSADEFLAVYRNHNNRLPRFSVYEAYQFDDMYLRKPDGSIVLGEAAHKALVDINFTILDAGGGQYPPTVVRVSDPTQNALMAQGQLSLADLGFYVKPSGIRMLRPGHEMGHQGRGFTQSYMSFSPEAAVAEINAEGLLRKIEKANGGQFLWPKLLASIDLHDVDPSVFTEEPTQAQLDACARAVLSKSGSGTRH